ncbi:sphingosine kinase [Actinoplanes sp. SE50]|uniref:diacylglycerol/lipid kinase family protein n=1 Tax=unclassified Actinoplanes TaxID=2626549 RepID=UPI00023EBC59|nr:MULTISPECIES: diacylglycerol kinase family protein [unclassified Actinoplanes]AEV87938.1 putative lipid kinase yegS-like protein [Actinoplanes sp. SE50/110]ATO86342.1 sphingosine kinase [Actinoplanes sp. SE50]SLM03757.1 sphingosine kinase [Actinoplanes sp. SE50/110]
MRTPRTIAVVAHQNKTLGGGLDELRRRLTDHDIKKLLWYEVPKSRKAPKQVRKALREKPDLLVVWGGDGMVQRTLDVVAGSDTPVAIMPAGTGNLLAGNLGIPTDMERAVEIAFEGDRKRLDLGKVDGEHFAVMAGVGFDGAMIKDADGALKDRFGKLAYVWTGIRHVDGDAPRTTIKIDGTAWFDDTASCVLIGNVGTITGGIHAFDDASPTDGWLDVGVATAQGALQWARALGTMAVKRSDSSPFVRTTRARKIDVKLESKLEYELDGGARSRTKRFSASIVPAAVQVCVPAVTDN